MDMRSRNRARVASAALLFGPVLILLLITGVVGLTTSVDPYFLISDPASITGTAFYVGAVTNIGVLMWWSTASLCVFSYVMATRLHPGRGEPQFLLWIGLLTAVLALDDMFLLHERVAPVYFGIQEMTVYAIYATIALALFLRFRRLILSSDVLRLAVAIFFFSCSQVVDLARGEGLDFYGVGFIEEAFKLLGIAGWLGYFAHLCGRQLAGESTAVNPAQRADMSADRVASRPTEPSLTSEGSYARSPRIKRPSRNPPDLETVECERRKTVPR